MVRRHPSNLGHGHEANVCASVRVDVVDNSGYSSLVNVRILIVSSSSLRLLTFASNRYPENIGQMFRFGQFFRINGLKNHRTAQTAV